LLDHHRDNFSPASDESGMTVFVAKSAPRGQQLRFSLVGEGTAPREAQGDNNMGAGEGTSSGPGGGLGTPIGAPAPLSAMRRSTSAPETRTAPPAIGGVSVLDAIKDELFQIESDREAGKISEDEYASAKSGLDALLHRQMKKAN
jgi:hypothetical protein